MSTATICFPVMVSMGASEKVIRQATDVEHRLQILKEMLK